jgi:hypothetical protein
MMALKAAPGNDAVPNLGLNLVYAVENLHI